MISGGTSGGFLDSPEFKNLIWVIGGIISALIALTFGFWIGLLISILVGITLNLIIGNDLDNFKSILLYLSSLIAWTATGAGIAATYGLLSLGIVAPVILLIIVMLIVPLFILDLVLIHASIDNKKIIFFYRSSFTT
jgi:uncharacterized membrane protein